MIPSSFATLAIGRDVSITIFTASSRNSGEKLFFGRGNNLTFPEVPIVVGTLSGRLGALHIQLPVESMTVQLQVGATRTRDAKAGFSVPIVNVELGGAAGW